MSVPRIGDNVVIVAGGRVGVAATIAREHPPTPSGRRFYWLEAHGQSLGYYESDEIGLVAAPPEATDQGVT